MRHTRNLILWTAGGLLGLALMVWAYPRLFPLLPERWDVSRGEAEAIALERLRSLGESLTDPYVVVRLRSDVQLERRLQILSKEIDGLREHRLADALLVWDVLVYAPGATPDRWTYRAMVTLDGEVLALRRWVDTDREATRPGLGPEELHQLAVASLVEQGVDVSSLASGGDLTGEGRLFQIHQRDDVLGDRLPWGIEVAFDGDQPAGYSLWYRDPARDELQDVLRQAQILGIGRAVLLYLLLPLVAVPFLRRYHDGQLGVRRGVQLFVVVLGAGLVSLLLNAPAISQSWSIGVVTRHQVTWMVVVFGLVFQVLGIAALGLMTWSVGEYFCRQHWPEKLASIDALFRLKVANATVARAALRGVSGGLLMTGVLLALTLPLHRYDAWPTAGLFVDTVLSPPAPSAGRCGG